MADGSIDQSTEGGISLIELNHPPVNSYTHEMLRELDDGLLKARFDDDTHVIVITGKGEKFFSAGADINMLGSQTLSYKSQLRAPRPRGADAHGEHSQAGHRGHQRSLPSAAASRSPWPRTSASARRTAAAWAWRR